ncbi:MAG: hypothetical protein A3H57_02305 [Candidatus Taylorbacteria bacterium RIFCSPLOWO2_02_FULL_43_11]|uniref:Ribosome-binding factor A n=1 Tax=Candidatus Taylorbacteria bacterium RIFCSPHIGHO2_02_FULL_43_32b TaxID=1802306 RepID=A0A1G2MKF6_9BACT|nr:MAG: hypothetical protein A2743_02025 [Candidatus Taylorbacteria bacterium RIFCSPHIGHO2_01_FULL_43_47]OHA24328.1 MAG: hypothetical protein A3C72_03450 [Candidatus Taylorbacteria bacterium RIFCSPHIGHO2_02_FULL_43_32b]OHA31371.1 MAG: hypothetical protein A3B08_00380 [Candidatus Taylorbacteria bacterium RIFCSPLOWO2_01_FULL_43_44]OHA37737.1 MAG: hypothetical protein A3H57_02305 [Candidatus Taylorbacteria bacterium RIFCSPLOWO2_02_FULL_43_11]
MNSKVEETKKKNDKIAAIVSVAASEFFKRESDRTSMITVTRTEIKDRSKKALIYITVFPEDKEETALSFTKRKRTELHNYLINETGLVMVPFVDIEIDIGEKNRQKIEAIKLDIK